MSEEVLRLVQLSGGGRWRAVEGGEGILGMFAGKRNFNFDSQIFLWTLHSSTEPFYLLP